MRGGAGCRPSFRSATRVPRLLLLITFAAQAVRCAFARPMRSPCRSAGGLRWACRAPRIPGFDATGRRRGPKLAARPRARSRTVGGTFPPQRGGPRECPRARARTPSGGLSRPQSRFAKPRNSPRFGLAARLRRRSASHVIWEQNRDTYQRPTAGRNQSC